MRRGRQVRLHDLGGFSKQHGFGPFALAWANKNTLDKVAAALKQDPKVALDLTFLLRNGDTGYPSVIDGMPSNPPSTAQPVGRISEA